MAPTITAANTIACFMGDELRGHASADEDKCNDAELAAVAAGRDPGPDLARRPQCAPFRGLTRASPAGRQGSFPVRRRDRFQPCRIQANTAARSFGANWRTVAALKMSVIRKASSAHFSSAMMATRPTSAW